MPNLRKDMDPKFMWDFSHIFATREDWEKAYAEAEEAIAAIGSVAGTLCESAESLAAGLGAIYSAAQKTELVYLYASLHKNGDNGDPEYQQMEGRAINLFVALSTNISFMEPEILAADESLILSYLEDDKLKSYRQIIHEILRAREHMLSAEQEKMLAMLSDVASNCQNAFEMLESVDMTFPSIIDEEGKEVTLTHGNFGVYRESGDARVRRESFEKYFGEFNKYINTFAAMYAGSVKTDAYFSRVRGYKDPCEAALFSGNVPVSVYDSLCDAVHEGLPTMKKYLELRKKALVSSKSREAESSLGGVLGVNSYILTNSSLELNSLISHSVLIKLAAEVRAVSVTYCEEREVIHAVHRKCSRNIYTLAARLTLGDSGEVLVTSLKVLCRAVNVERRVESYCNYLHFSSPSYILGACASR